MDKSARDFTTISVEKRTGVDIVSLNRPDALNAVSATMLAELTAYLTSLYDDLDTRVVILRANGRAFCAGAELSPEVFAAPGEGRAKRQFQMQQRFSGIVRLMRSCPQPIVALIHGAACGAGFSLALASDVRFASPQARMNAAYIRVGVGGCDMGSGYLLPRLVGVSVASELLLSGRFIEAERARVVGLVSDVVPEDQLLETGLAFAADLMRASPMGLRFTKQTLNALIDAPSLETALALEDRQQVILLETSDHHEAVAAFREKRPPVYRDQ